MCITTHVCGAVAASPVNSMEVLSDCRNDFILLLLLEAPFDLLCSCFPYPLPSWRVFLLFVFCLTLWTAEVCFNWSLDSLDWLLIQRNLPS